MNDDRLQPRIHRRSADTKAPSAGPEQVPRQEDAALLRYVLDAAPDGIAVLDRDLNVVETNAWVRERYGLEATPIGQKCYAVFHDRESPCPGCRASHVLDTGKPHRFVESYPSAGADTVRLDVQLLPLKDDRGQIVGVAEYARDVTRYEMAEKNLQASEDRFRALSRMMSDLAYSIRIEPDGSIALEWMTDAFTRVTGFTPEEAITLSGWMDIVHPDDLDAIARRTVLLLAGEPTVCEYRVVTKKGRVHWVQDYTLPLFDEEQGRVVRLVGAAHDITERRQMEEELRRSREEYRDLVENINDVIYATDREGIVTYISPVVESILGYRPSEIVGQPFEDFVDRETLRHIRRNMRILFSGRSVASECRLLTKSGEERWLHTSSKPLLVNDEVAGIRGVLTDVTEHRKAEAIRQELEARLERARRMESLGSLAGGVAHDLNNILGPLVAYPELVVEQLPPDSPIREDVLQIQRSANEAAAVVQDLLALARRGAYRMAPLDLNVVVQDYLDSLSYTELVAGCPQVPVHVDLEPDLLNIRGSSTHLFKVVMNLVTNAVEAMPDGGKLTIETRCQSLDRPIVGHEYVEAGDYVVLRVRDTGLGIEPEDLNRIFEPFFTKKAMGRSGSGLGLSVVYGVVHDHEGVIDVESEVGRGTEFRVYFPVYREQIPEIVEEDAEYGGTETVLVVDDVKVQRDLAVRMLSPLGYRVDAVESGRAAIRYLCEHSVDILLLDMVMEDDFDGLDTYREAIQIHPGQKAVIASGFSRTERVEAAQALGAGPLVAKPYRKRDLARAIRQELDDG